MYSLLMAAQLWAFADSHHLASILHMECPSWWVITPSNKSQLLCLNFFFLHREAIIQLFMFALRVLHCLRLQ